MNDASAGYSGTSGSLPVILALGTTQTIAWASSYYLPAILAAPIARDLGLAPTFVYGALSGALVIAGLLGPRVGHAIDTFGGRGLLAVSNGVLAAGLLLLRDARLFHAAGRNSSTGHRRSAFVFYQHDIPDGVVGSA